jgi:hypothetical protein
MTNLIQESVSHFNLSYDNRAALTGTPGDMLIISPLFDVSSRGNCPPWRTSVTEVSAYLQTNATVEVDHLSGTGIRISIAPSFSLTEVKRIAQCGIHFEPAIEALLPPSPDDGYSYMSNWVLSWDFAPSGRTRPDSIELIENSPDLAAVSDLMQRNSPRGNFTWEFNRLGQRPETINFYRCPPFHNAQEAIRYLEFTVCFVGVAMRCPKEQLLRIPSNVGGLRWFLIRFRNAWLYNCARMQSLWSGIPMDAMAEPRLPEWRDDQLEFIEENNLNDVEEMITQDMARCRAFANNAQPPYF